MITDRPMPMPTSSWLDQLFGLQRLSFSQEGVALGWRHGLALWVWLLLIVGLAAVAALSYWKLLGPRPVRLLLTVNRTLLLLVLAALLAGPMLVLSSEKVEEDWLLILVDRSASMQIEDMTIDPAAQTAASRDAVLRRALREQSAVFSEAGLAAGRQVHWLGFDGEAYRIDGPADLPPPEGQRTALRTAIEQSLQLAAGRPVSGIVLMSDGRSPQSTGVDLVRRLQQQAVSVFAVPLGAAEAPLDLSIGQVDAPERAFVNDAAPVNVWIDAQGDTSGLAAGRLTVRLRDAATRAVLDERELEASDVAGREPLQLSSRSEAAGPAQWIVEIDYQPPDAAPLSQRELVRTNNAQTLGLEFIDRPLRVLYVDGYPRWEYRYLKNLLIREQSVQSSMLLWSADREFAQEGDLPITRLPNTAEELEPFDVIIVGDVPPAFFSPEQIGLIRDHVASRGAGLLWIGGERDLPTAYEGNPMADLLPMRRPGSVGRLVAAGGLAVVPTPLADTFNVMRLIEPGQAAEATWPRSLPPLWWAQDLGELKQAAEVLAIVRPIGAGLADDAGPLVARLRYGAGQSLYVASDDLWRWRYGRGELYHEQFWVQLIRMLARGRLDAAVGRVQLVSSNKRLSVDQATVIELIVDDPVVAAQDLARIAVSVRAVGDGGPESGGQIVDQIDLLPVPEEPTVGARSAPSGRRRVYRATWRPRDAGRFRLAVADPALDERSLHASVEVLSPDDEMRQTLPDHERLAALAEQTGGAVVPIDDLARLQELVPNRARKTPDDQREPLWNSYVALGVVLLLLTTEWIGRKLVRLA